MIIDLGKIATTPKGQYIPGVPYENLDVVTDAGSSYVSLIEDNLNPLSDNITWQLIASKGDTGYKTIGGEPVNPTDLAPTIVQFYQPTVSSDVGLPYPNLTPAEDADGNPTVLTAKNNYNTLFYFNGSTWIKSETKFEVNPPIDVIVKDNTVDPVNGKAVNDFTIAEDVKILNSIGTTITNAQSLNFLTNYKNTDRTIVTSPSVWRSGYLTTNNTVGTSTTWIYSIDYIALPKGFYVCSLVVTGAAAIITYNSAKAVLSTYTLKGDASGTEWIFEMPSDGFIRFSYDRALDANSNPLVLKLESRKLTNRDKIYTPTSNVFIENKNLKTSVANEFGINITPIGNNYISELTGSDIYNTSLWLPGYLSNTGTVLNGANWYHSVKLYSIPKGVFNYKLCFSGNAKVIVRSKKTGLITQVIERLSGGSLHEGAIVTTEDSTIQLSHIIQLPNTYTADIFVKNSVAVTPTLINSENISDYSSSKFMQKLYKDSHRPRIKRKIVTFISDDGYGSESSWFCPLIEEYGIRATLAIVRDWVGTVQGGVTMLTETQIKDLYNKGHEIASHTSNHGHLNALTASQANVILSDNKTYLERLLNYDCKTFISPFGENNKTTDNVSVQKLVSAYHDCNVITGYGSLNTPPINSLFLNRVGFDLESGQTSRFPTILQPIIDASTAQNNWLMFAFHSARGEYNTRKQELRDMINYLLSQGYEFMTVREAMNYYRNPVQIGLKNVDISYYYLGMDGTEENVNYF